MYSLSDDKVTDRICQWKIQQDGTVNQDARLQVDGGVTKHCTCRTGLKYRCFLYEKE